ncbi:hypothetical protein H0H81_004775 [Sphagnurus paluster]|uniref:Uncharacterized protein n=1 Tax=Sphagnurus paluster TaxID=117069 RepID=A0A9P7K260_9AGAR|nr:hypothetical protein H0H81_004775 [Sphagnurus paluster]
MTSTRRFVKQVVFAEGGKITACGSNVGKVHVVDVATRALIQSLALDSDNDLVQAVAAVTVDTSGHLIVGGSTTSAYLWRKKPEVVPPAQPAATVSSPVQSSVLFNYSVQGMLNAAIIILVALISYRKWSPALWKACDGVSSNYILLTA